MGARARREEVALIDALAESDDTDGVIGIQARASLKRLPSSVYWQGLARWGIRLFPGSQEQYHRSLDGFYDRIRRIQRDDEGTPPRGNREVELVLGITSHTYGLSQESLISTKYVSVNSPGFSRQRLAN